MISQLLAVFSAVFALKKRSMLGEGGVHGDEHDRLTNSKPLICPAVVELSNLVHRNSNDGSRW